LKSAVERKDGASIITTGLRPPRAGRFPRTRALILPGELIEVVHDQFTTPLHFLPPRRCDALLRSSGLELLLVTELRRVFTVEHGAARRATPSSSACAERAASATARNDDPRD
jgi:hypothetical protein